jgi:hypothetical protein
MMNQHKREPTLGTYLAEALRKSFRSAASLDLQKVTPGNSTLPRPATPVVPAPGGPIRPLPKKSLRLTKAAPRISVIDSLQAMPDLDSNSLGKAAAAMREVHAQGGLIPAGTTTARRR